MTGPFPKAHACVLASLKQLKLQVLDTKELLLSLDTPHLLTFSYSGSAFKFDPALWPSLPELTELELEFEGDLGCPSLIPDIFKLRLLKKLTVYGLEESQILALVKGLPQLILLNTGTTQWRDKTIIGMGQYLRVTKRNVKVIRNCESLIGRLMSMLPVFN